MIPRTVAHQAIQLPGISRQGYWSQLQFPLQGSKHPGTEPLPPALVDGLFTTEPSEEPHNQSYKRVNMDEIKIVLDWH